MVDYYNIHQFTGKKGPATYKAAKESASKGTYANVGGKKATNKKVSMVDKKVKRVTSKIIKFKSKNPGKSAFDRY